MSDNAAYNTPPPYQSVMALDGTVGMHEALHGTGAYENKYMVPKRVDENGFTDDSEDEVANDSFKSGKKAAEKAEVCPAWMVKKSGAVTKSFDKFKTRLANMKKDVLKHREVESTLSSSEEMRIHFENFVNKTERWQGTAEDTVNGIRHLVTTIEKDTGVLELSDGVVTNEHNNPSNLKKDGSALPWMDKQTAAVENMFRKFQLASQKMKEKVLELEKMRTQARTRDEMKKHDAEIDRLSANWDKITDEAILQITTSLELAKNFEEHPDSAENTAETMNDPGENYVDYLRHKLKIAETLNAANVPKLAEVDKLKRNLEHFQLLFVGETAADKLKKEDTTTFDDADLPIIDDNYLGSWAALAEHGSVKTRDSMFNVDKLDNDIFSMATYFADNSMSVVQFRPDGIERNGVRAFVNENENVIYRVLCVETAEHQIVLCSMQNNTAWSAKRVKKSSPPTIN